MFMTNFLSIFILAADYFTEIVPSMYNCAPPISLRAPKEHLKNRFGLLNFYEQNTV